MNHKGHLAEEIMQDQEPAKIKVKLLSSKHRESIVPLWLFAAILFTSASAQEVQKSKPDPLMIQEQGSFAVGGSVPTAPGPFDPIRRGAFTPAGTDPAGQTLHGD